MIARFLRADQGAVAAEFVLMLPIMILLLFLGMEGGHFAWSQHNLIKAVREGTRYASRLPVDSFCDGATQQLDPDAEDLIKAIVVTGALPPADGGAARGPVVFGLQADQVTVDPDCAVLAPGDEGFGTGIYSDLGNGGPVVTITVAGVPYPSLFERLGVIDGSYRLTATASAPVIGI